VTPVIPFPFAQQGSSVEEVVGASTNGDQQVEYVYYDCEGEEITENTTAAESVQAEDPVIFTPLGLGPGPVIIQHPITEAPNAETPIIQDPIIVVGPMQPVQVSAAGNGNAEASGNTAVAESLQAEDEVVGSTLIRSFGPGPVIIQHPITEAPNAEAPIIQDPIIVVGPMQPVQVSAAGNGNAEASGNTAVAESLQAEDEVVGSTLIRSFGPGPVILQNPITQVPNAETPIIQDPIIVVGPMQPVQVSAAGNGNAEASENTAVAESVPAEAQAVSATFMRPYRILEPIVEGPILEEPPLQLLPLQLQPLQVDTQESNAGNGNAEASIAATA